MGAQVKQFLGVCKGVSGELSSETGGLSNGVPPPNAGGAPQGGWASPGWVPLHCGWVSTERVPPQGGWVSPGRVPPRGGWGSSIH